jgi:hypothetical protein
LKVYLESRADKLNTGSTHFPRPEDGSCSRGKNDPEILEQKRIKDPSHCVFNILKKNIHCLGGVVYLHSCIIELMGNEIESCQSIHRVVFHFLQIVLYLGLIADQSDQMSL